MMTLFNEKIIARCMVGATLLCMPMSHNEMKAQPSLTFSTEKRGPVMSDLHYGLFYEEINHGGDGGLYAELIRNRSFEDNVANPDCWWGLGGMKMELVSTGLLNDVQGKALKLTVNEYDAGVRNEGFWGMNIVKDEEYTLTFWAKTDGSYSGKLWAELQDDVFVNLGRTEFDVELTSEWQKFTVRIKATASNRKGWLAIKGLEPMVMYLDVVSLMPPTYKNRPNGCRRDLAEMLEALSPRFLRFPGGCYVEGTWQNNTTNRFEWKKTIGPIEERPGHMNVNWGYRVSDGFGFHEMLQFSEDLGAEPLFVCNVGLGHGWFQDYTRLNDYIQEALDAIEYANGDVTTKYGKLRAENGHPEPFNLRLLEIGNENYNFISGDNGDQSDHYAERYAAFYRAIKAKYPDMILIGNVESWATDDPSWRNGNPVEIVDEHYYRSTEWFRNQYNKYDNYSRDGYKVYAGEYAVTSDFGSWGNLNAALGEAIYMAGMERNSDVCVMASYAPLLCNENHAYPWMPDMIRFNSYSAFGTPSYWVQKLMANNVGHQNITWEERGNTNRVRDTYVGLSSWGTSVVYDNFSIKDTDGNVVYSTQFASPADYELNWNATGGTWTLSGGTLQQTNTAMYGNCNVCYNLTGEDCVIELDAKKVSGAEGFLIAFSYNDPDNYVWWNIGGWNNTRHAIEQCIDGVKRSLASAEGSINTGQTYRLKIVKSGNQVYCYIDGVLCHKATLQDSKKIYTTAALNKAEDELIVKLINPNASVQEAALNFKDFECAGNVSLEVLKSASGNDENIMQNQFVVKPVASEFAPQSEDGKGFVYAVPPYSLNILRIPVKNVSAEVQNPTVDEEGWEDVTDRLVNPDFTDGQTGWTGTFTNVTGTVAEFFNSTFNSYQTLTNMPAGEYKLCVDGFYRYGSIEHAYTNRTNGTEKLNARLFITTDRTTAYTQFMSLYDESAPFAYEPDYTYPDNMAGANLAFNFKNAYKGNEVRKINETEGGTIRIGFVKSLSVANDWTCFDNVRLYYRPMEKTAIGEIEADDVEHGDSDVYDLTGRKVANPTKGIYIKDGKLKYMK